MQLAWGLAQRAGKYTITLSGSQAWGRNEDKSNPAAHFLMHTMKHKAAVWNILRDCVQLQRMRGVLGPQLPHTHPSLLHSQSSHMLICRFLLKK